MKLYIVAFRDEYDEVWQEPYLADNIDHAEEQCRDANPPDIEILDTSCIPFYMVERAYYLSKEKQAK